MIGAARIMGAVGEALTFDGEILTLTLSRPFAPGTPIRGAIATEGVDVGIDGRVMARRKQADGTFEVRARLVSLPRHARRKLEGLGDRDDP